MINGMADFKQRLADMERGSAQQTDMITQTIKDLYRFCQESSERQVSHTELIVNEAIQELNRRYEAFSCTQSQGIANSTQGSNHNVGRLYEPHSSSMSVTETADGFSSPNRLPKMNKLLSEPIQDHSISKNKFEEFQRHMYKLQQIIEAQAQENIDEMKEQLEKQFEIKLKKL